MVAIELSTVRDIALGIVVGAIVLAVVLAVVIRWIVGKLIAVAILVVLAGVVWWQREEVEDCADRVRAAPTTDTTCTFFGRDVTVDSPLD